MEFFIATFRARSQTLTFANILRSYNVPCSIINTPRVINVSCGISVRLLPSDLTIAESIIRRRKFDTFAGFYRVIFDKNQYKLLKN